MTYNSPHTLIVPRQITGAFPLDSPLAPTTPTPEHRKQAVRDFLDAVSKGAINLETVDVQNGLEIATVDRFGLPFRTILCQRTGLIYTSPRLSEHSLPLYYEQFYHRLHFSIPVTELNALFRGDVEQGKKVWARILPHLHGHDSSLAILEIGAGVGNILSEIRHSARQHGYDPTIVGTEHSSECIQAAADRGIAMVQGGIDSLLTANRQFDVIIMSHVFEHIVNLDSALDALRRLIRPDGLLYIEVPGVATIHKQYRYQFDWVNYVTHAHIRHFCMASLQNVVSNGGFELITGNEEVSAVFRSSSDRPMSLPLPDAPDVVAFLRGYLALLATDRLSVSNALNAIDTPQTAILEIRKLNSQLADSRARISYYDNKRRSLWWLLSQIARVSIPLVDRLASTHPRRS